MTYAKSAVAATTPAELNWQWGARAIAHSRFWFFLIATLGSVSNVVYTCTVPLVGFGVLAGATLPRHRALIVILSMWLVNQLLGFTIHHYPWTLTTFAWGFVLGLGAVLATWLASMKPKLSQQQLTSYGLWLGIALIAGYCLYELVIWLASFALGGGKNFTLPILWGIFWGNSVWAIALAGTHSLLVWDTLRTRSVRAASRIS